MLPGCAACRRAAPCPRGEGDLSVGKADVGVGGGIAAGHSGCARAGAGEPASAGTTPCAGASNWPSIEPVVCAGRSITTEGSGPSPPDAGAPPGTLSSWVTRTSWGRSAIGVVVGTIPKRSAHAPTPAATNPTTPIRGRTRIAYCRPQPREAVGSGRPLDCSGPIAAGRDRLLPRNGHAE